MKADRAKLLESSTVVTNKLREELAENTRYYVGRLNEAGATIGIFKDKLAAAQAKNQRLHNNLDSSQAQVAELRLQLQKERAPREKIETKLSNLKQKSATASELPEASASPDEHPDYPIYLEVCKSREAGKSTTWIVENILKMGGRKFSDGKVKLRTLLNQFEEEGK